MSTQLLIVAAAFLATFAGLGAAGVAFAGTAAVGTDIAALVTTHRLRRLPWAAIGLSAPGGAGRLALHTMLALVVGWCAALAAMLLAIRGLGWAATDVSRFADVRGDIGALAGALVISWTTAAVGEEILFRGFLQARLRALFGESRGAGALAVLAQAMLFGLAHAYQGGTGVLVSGAIGLAFGLLMLRFRTVWPLVLAHGLIDTVSMVALYTGAGAG